MGLAAIVKLMLAGVLLMVLVDCVSSRSQGLINLQKDPPSSCVCRGRYYRLCPESCLIRNILESETDFNLPATRTSIHKDHPDHIENQELPLPIPDTNEGVVAIDRHRKVYLADNQNDEPKIHPISLEIPVEVKDDGLDYLPPLEHVVRMHKYTTTEIKPKVEMMPVTTTVLKRVVGFNS